MERRGRRPCRDKKNGRRVGNSKTATRQRPNPDDTTASKTQHKKTRLESAGRGRAPGNLVGVARLFCPALHPTLATPKIQPGPSLCCVVVVRGCCVSPVRSWRLPSVCVNRPIISSGPGPLGTIYLPLGTRCAALSLSFFFCARSLASRVPLLKELYACHIEGRHPLCEARGASLHGLAGRPLKASR